MPFKEGDDTVEFEGVIVCDRRPKEKQDKGLFCRFADGNEKFVPFSQCPEAQQFPRDEGEEFDLEVSAWMVETWANEPPPTIVKLPGVEAIGESDKYGPALQVKLADGQKLYCPTKAIAPDSPVQQNGDRGELWALEWWAKSKNLTGETARGTVKPGVPQGNKRAAPAAAHVGADARTGAVDDGDDDIPFD